MHLAPATVNRRIKKMREGGLIDCTVSINHDMLGTSSGEAYVELSFTGDADVHAILDRAMANREVREAMTIAGGGFDALVRVRAASLAALRDVVAKLRTLEAVTGSQTKIVLGRRWHGHRSAPE